MDRREDAGEFYPGGKVVQTQPVVPAIAPVEPSTDPEAAGKPADAKATGDALATKYQKPQAGIPKSDMDASVQSSLARADTALQSAPVSSVNGKTGAVVLGAEDVGAIPTTGGIVSGNLRFSNGNYFIALLPGDALGVSGPIIMLSDGQGNTSYVTPTGIKRGSGAFIGFPSVAGTLALSSDLALLAPLASPAFTGTPTAPTIQDASDSSTKLATTAFVQAAIQAGGGGGGGIPDFVLYVDVQTGNICYNTPEVANA